MTLPKSGITEDGLAVMIERVRTLVSETHHRRAFLRFIATLEAVDAENRRLAPRSAPRGAAPRRPVTVPALSRLAILSRDGDLTLEFGVAESGDRSFLAVRHARTGTLLAVVRLGEMRRRILETLIGERDNAPPGESPRALKSITLARRIGRVGESIRGDICRLRKFVLPSLGFSQQVIRSTRGGFWLDPLPATAGAA